MTEEVTTTTTTEAPSDSLITAPEPALDFSTGRPEAFPEDFWDSEKNAPAIDKLFKSYTNEKTRAEGLRVKLSKGEFTGKAPEDINEYIVELSDELKPIIPDNDPIFNAAKQAAKDAGLPKEAFSKFMQPVIAKLAEQKAALEAGPSPEEIQAVRQAEIEKLGPTGNKIVEAVGSFIDQLHAGGTFSEAEAKAAKAMVTNADAARVLNKFRMMSGAPDQVPVDVQVSPSASRSDIEAKMSKAMLSGNEADYTKYSAMLAKMNN